VRSDHPQTETKGDITLAIIECSIPAELTIAEWRRRRSTARQPHFYRLRSFMRTLGGQA